LLSTSKIRSSIVLHRNLSLSRLQFLGVLECGGIKTCDQHFENMGLGPLAQSSWSVGAVGQSAYHGPNLLLRSLSRRGGNLPCRRRHPLKPSLPVTLAIHSMDAPPPPSRPPVQLFGAARDAELGLSKALSRVEVLRRRRRRLVQLYSLYRAQY
jgi:hypothetical protein